jgi:hypothetical protein
MLQEQFEDWPPSPPEVLPPPPGELLLLDEHAAIENPTKNATPMNVFRIATAYQTSSFSVFKYPHTMSALVFAHVSTSSRERCSSVIFSATELSDVITNSP